MKTATFFSISSRVKRRSSHFQGIEFSSSHANHRELHGRASESNRPSDRVVGERKEGNGNDPISNELIPEGGSKARKAAEAKASLIFPLSLENKAMRRTIAWQRQRERQREEGDHGQWRRGGNVSEGEKRTLFWRIHDGDGRRRLLAVLVFPVQPPPPPSPSRAGSSVAVNSFYESASSDDEGSGGGGGGDGDDSGGGHHTSPVPLCPTGRVHKKSFQYYDYVHQYRTVPFSVRVCGFPAISRRPSFTTSLSFLSLILSHSHFLSLISFCVSSYHDQAEMREDLQGNERSLPWLQGQQIKYSAKMASVFFLPCFSHDLFPWTRGGFSCQLGCCNVHRLQSLPLCRILAICPFVLTSIFRPSQEGLPKELANYGCDPNG